VPSIPRNDQARTDVPPKQPVVRRVTAAAVARRKGKAPFAMMTAYDAPFAGCVEEAGIDLILVGDSVGNNVLGYDSTTPVTLSDMLHHTAAVARGTVKAHIVTDLPFGTYQASDADAIRAATRVVQEGGASSVKLEGGARARERIKAIVGAGIPVMAHIGLLPQTAGLGPGFKVRSDREALLADARAVEAAGAYAVVLEVVDHGIAAEIGKAIAIPTIGIGSGKGCDGQVLVMHDVLGLHAIAPSFVKQYANLRTEIISALEHFASDVKDRSFPAD